MIIGFGPLMSVAVGHNSEELPVVFLSKILEEQVVVIDVANDTVIRVLRTGSNPAEIGVLEGLNRAYVADLTDGTVAVISSPDYRILDVIPLNSPVAAVDVDQTTQTVYAVDFSNGVSGTNLHVIDAQTNTETADFTVGQRTQNVAVSSLENRAYVTDFIEGIIVVNIDTNSVETTIPMTGLPHGVAVDEVSSQLYVTRLESDTVAVIDTTTLTVGDVLPVGDVPQWIVLDPPRNKAFVTNEGDGTVSVIDTSTNTVHPAAIPVGVSPLTLTIHEGAAKAYVYNLGDGTISVIDTVSETVIATISVVFSDGFESGDTSAWTTAAPSSWSVLAQR